MIREPLAAELLLGQPVALDHRAHRAVEDQDPARHQLAQALLHRAHRATQGDGLDNCGHWLTCERKQQFYQGVISKVVT
jgi:hypothetical protein